MRPQLAALNVGDVCGGKKPADATMARACLAGLWLYFDFLDDSHTISQEIETTTGSFWHAMMHRREGDYGNSKYWWRRVGDHPVFAELAASVQPLVDDPATPAEFCKLTTKSSWDPYTLVDLCQSACGGRNAWEPLCVEIQRREWELLFDFCFDSAVGER